MKITEVIELCKAGFKAADIKKMMDQEAEEKNAPEPQQELPKEKPAEEVKEAPKENFEALYKKTLDELTKTKEDLNAAQMFNQSKGVADPVPGIETYQKNLTELLRR